MSTSTNVIRYAPYIEEQHSDFLSLIALHRNVAIADSPYSDYEDVEVNEAFFGLGYLMTDFATLYETFGDFMAGLDLATVWHDMFDRVLDRPEIDAKLTEEMQIVDDKIIIEDLANFQTAMRNMNAVASSTFVVGKAMIEDQRIKMLCSMSLESKDALMNLVGVSHDIVLNWSKNIVTRYALSMKDYFSWKIDIDDANYSYAAKDLLWLFKVMDFERAALGVLQGATVNKKLDPRERSTVSKVLLVASDTVTGVVIGAQVGGVPGAIIGGVIGFLVGIAQILFE